MAKIHCEFTEIQGHGTEKDDYLEEYSND